MSYGLREQSVWARARERFCVDYFRILPKFKFNVVMAIKIIRLGSPRFRGEGLRIGTVRRPPRGVPKNQFAKKNWYDVWFPILAPSDQTVKFALSASTPAEWARFVKKYRAEMSMPDTRHALALLAELSHQTSFSVGCYCEDESRCHRSVLRQLLKEQGAEVD
jgi:uncharacterized protein YeaO (DUF488 family)